MNRIRSDCSREGSKPKPEPAERGTPLPPPGFAGTGDGEDREDEDGGDEGESDGEDWVGGVGLKKLIETLRNDSPNECDQAHLVAMTGDGVMNCGKFLVSRTKSRATKLKRETLVPASGRYSCKVNSLGRAGKRFRRDPGRARGYMRGLAGKLDSIQYSRFLVHWQCRSRCVKLQVEVQLRRWR